MSEMSSEALRHSYSIVMPVYNSSQIVATTIDRVVEVFTTAGLTFELICVNDGSPDESWAVISERAASIPGVIALDLMKNYGQHYANLAGLIESTGDYVITLDDDLQNPPDQALLLIETVIRGGHEVVFGQFEQKQAHGVRRIGSLLIGQINRRIFAQPANLTVSNFRILRRDVVDRIVSSRTAYPYITGQALMASRDRANVMVRHDPRPSGKSNYNLTRIIGLVLTILFSYSSWPLKAAALLGFAISGLSFLLGGFLIARALLTETIVPGWTSIMVLMSIFAGVIIALLSMIGEYVVRTLNTVSRDSSFHVVRRVGR
ncbi:MAG: glycosyltransferase family 2 protein [Ornithinimicrobium sp.]